MNNNNCLTRTLSLLSFAAPITFENLTMVPLLTREPGDHAEYDLLDDALASHALEIMEVSEQGSVPELRVVNHGARPVLVIDGEELVGAKQNRVVNLTILVPAASTLTIPVSCVEAGRWRARSRTFAAAPRAQYATGRAKRMSQVTACMRESRGYHSDQAEVWLDIAEKSARLGANSPTSAMAALFAAHAPKLEAFVQALTPVEGQVGALFIVSGQVVGLDLFDRPFTLRRLLPKLVRSAAVDAIDDGASGKRGPGAAASGAKLFVSALSAAATHRAPAIGLGDDVRLTAPGLTGAALEVGGAVVHVSGFATA
jgi:hypothetical protein